MEEAHGNICWQIEANNSNDALISFLCVVWYNFGLVLFKFIIILSLLILLKNKTKQNLIAYHNLISNVINIYVLHSVINVFLIQLSLAYKYGKFLSFIFTSQNCVIYSTTYSRIGRSYWLTISFKVSSNKLCFFYMRNIQYTFHLIRLT